MPAFTPLKCFASGGHACCGFKTAVCELSHAETLRSGPTLCLVGGSRVPFASLQSLQPPTAALRTVLLRAQDFKPLNAPQPPYTLSCLPFASLPTPYTLSCWGCKSASLQTPQRSAAALHSVLLKLLLKTPGCQPSNASTLHSGLTHSIVEAFGRLPAFRRVLSAPALHILSLGVHECRLPAFRPLFKPLNPPRRLYTLSCWGFQTTVC